MDIKKYSPLFFLLVSLVLYACGPSPAEFDATVTQIAAGVFQTQTEQAPTPTRTYTPSPMPTSTPIPTSTPPPSPTPTPVPPTPTIDPSILFADDFSNSDSIWDVGNEGDYIIEYADDKLQFSVNKPNIILRDTISRVYGDAVFEVDAQNMEGPLDPLYGVICRYQDASNYYFISIASDGHYAVLKLVDNYWSYIGSDGMKVNNMIINGDRKLNHLKVSCVGENLTLEVNGQVLISVKDSTFTNGAIGLAVNNFDQPGTVVQFDNFVASKP